MLILHDPHLSRGRVLMPVPRREWMPPSHAQQKTFCGDEDRTLFRLRAKTHDGRMVWQGWFEDRDDADAFLFALVSGSLHYERELWRMPTPEWHPGISTDLIYEFATQTFLTTTGSNQTYTSPSDWNNSSNQIQTIGAGGAGGAASTGSDNVRCATGGGGGAWNKVTNFSFASPGTTTATYRVGAGGTGESSTSGTPPGVSGGTGEDTYFGGVDLASSTVGSKGGTGGATASAISVTGAAGGVGSSGKGTSSNNGGAGGTLSLMGANTQNSSGGGGSAGPNGAGNDGVSSTGGNDVRTSGGSGDAGSGGSAGTAPGGAGGNGTEWSASYGSGGGGAGNRATGSSSATGGAGGNYGGGGGGSCGSGTGTMTGGAGIQGIIYVEYTPIVSFLFNPIPFQHILVR